MSSFGVGRHLMDNLTQGDVVIVLAVLVVITVLFLEEIVTDIVVAEQAEVLRVDADFVVSVTFSPLT